MSQKTVSPEPFDRILLIGHGSPHAEGNDEFLQFARQVEDHLGITVQPCFLELAEPSIEEGIRLCVEEGAKRIAVLPLFLGPAGHQKNDVAILVAQAREQYPDIDLRYGTPIGAQYQLVRVLEQRAADVLAHSSSNIAPSPLNATAVLLAARGSSDPDSNSEVFKLARLLYEGRDYGWVEACFQKVTPPNIVQGIERCIQLGAQRVIVLPYLLFTGFVRNDIVQQAEIARNAHPNVDILVGSCLFPHEGLTEAVAQRYHDIATGTATMTCDLCKYRHRMTGFEHDHGKPQTTHHHHHGHGHGHGHHHHHGHEHGHGHGHGHHHKH
jgi:sirohydrochlorin cobaltochelatase